MGCDLFDLSGRSALVTGGNKGLGKAIARGLAEAGSRVLIASRHGDELAAAAVEIAEGLPQAEVRTFVADLSVRDQSDALVREALALFGTVDIFVNNAGVNTPEAIDEIEDEVWDRTLEINVTAGMRITRALVPKMKEQRWGRIIHISSVLGVGSRPGRNSYSASKAALIGLTKASALDLGPFGITVNSIGPGPFLTDMPLSLLSEPEKEVFSQRTALKRWGQPRELAGPVLFLASEAGSYVTGEMLLVDGGAFARAL